jgi:hypothetical protein
MPTAPTRSVPPVLRQCGMGHAHRGVRAPRRQHLPRLATMGTTTSCAVAAEQLQRGAALRTVTRRRRCVTAKNSEQLEVEDEGKKVISPTFSLYKYKK